MDIKEMEEMGRKICYRSDVFNTCEACLEYNHASRCYYHEYAEIFSDAGYHKTVWHKVADGDLPKQKKDNVIAMPVQACCKNEIGIEFNSPCYFFFIDNTFRNLNSTKTLNVIAWTELPIYEENIDERR